MNRNELIELITNFLTASGRNNDQEARVYWAQGPLLNWSFAEEQGGTNGSTYQDWADAWEDAGKAL